MDTHKNEIMCQLNEIGLLICKLTDEKKLKHCDKKIKDLHKYLKKKKSKTMRKKKSVKSMNFFTDKQQTDMSEKVLSSMDDDLSYTQPEPSYTQPEPSYTQPEPSYTQSEPSYTQSINNNIDESSLSHPLNENSDSSTESMSSSSYSNITNPSKSNTSVLSGPHESGRKPLDL
jgi:hypothetical protein